MKKVTVCMVCYYVTVDGVHVNSNTTIIKLMLVAKYTPNLISIEKYVCHDCRTFVSKEYCDKILKKET